MGSRNSLCMQCKSNTAHMFCVSSSPETLLCMDCVKIHNISDLHTEHAARPIEQLPYYKIPGYFDRLVARQKGFPLVRQQALDSLGDVDRAIEEYNEAVEQILWTFTAEAKRVVLELKQHKEKLSEDVETALEEVEKTMREDEPVLKSSYGNLFRNAIEKSQTASLFNYSLKTSQIPFDTLANLQFNFASQQAFLSQQTFAGIERGTAFVYVIPSEQITKHNLSVDFGWEGSHVQINRNTIVSVGGRSSNSNVYSLDLRSFQLSSLPSLGTTRACSGVALATSHIYAFGGTGLSSCEKMQLFGKHWVPIGSMNYQRCGFTPCSLGPLFYLASANEGSAGKVETFNTKTETFVVLPISHSLSSCNWSLAFIANGELCILTYSNQMARWVIDSKEAYRISATTNSPWACQQPIRVGSQVLIYWGSSVHKFSLKTYSFV